MPDSYNAHYVRQGSNLNTLLTKTHLHSLTQLKRQWQCDAAQSAPLHCVVIDQFGSDAKIRQHCQGLDLPIILSPRAESQYMAVAAASCMARQTFVTRMQQLGEQWGMVLPLGAGPQVKRAKQVFVGQHGQDALPHVAKMHFKV
jgi:ribonuclease HIII